MSSRPDDMDDKNDKVNAFLRMIRRARRGRLKVYLGYAPGVGKTYEMLVEGRRLKEEGIDLVVGLVETHGRIETERLLEGLEILPRKKMQYRGMTVEEMDVDAILARAPQVVLIDELAHTNVPGSRNPKRYQDVQDVLAAGIHVITTLNVQHLESLYDMVEGAVGVKVRERLPDSVLAQADQIVNVDVSTEDLRERLKEGKVYTPERIEVALDHFFLTPNLEKLREITLRELASQIDSRRRDTLGDQSLDSAAPDQIMVSLSSRGPNSEKLLRYASRLAGRLNRNWYAVYVQTPSEEPTLIDARTQTILSGTLTLAKQLGAIVFTYRGEDVVRTLLEFAREYRVGHIIIGRPGSRSIWQRIMGRRSVVDRLIREATGVAITILDPREEAAPRPPLVFEEEVPVASGQVSEERVSEDRGRRMRLSPMLRRDRIVIWDGPVARDEALKRLAESIERSGIPGMPHDVLTPVLEREKQGSTFLNEGLALPHVRLKGIAESVISLGLTHGGISDEPRERPIELVFMIISPADDPSEQTRCLAVASKAAQNRDLLRDLRASRSAEDAIAAILRWESGSS